MIIFIVLWHIKIYRTVAYVSITGIQYLFDILYLLYYMPRCKRFYARRQHVEAFHRLVVAIHIKLNHFHWLKLLKTRFLGNFVLSIVGIMLKMTHIGDIAHISHLVAEITQVTEQDVERDGRSCMSQMRVAINCRTAHIHAHKRGVQRDKLFFLASKCIIYI